MARACHVAVNLATGEVFNEAEIDDLLQRMVDKANRAGKANPSLSQREAIAQAARELTREQAVQMLAEKRLKVAKAVAEKRRRADLDAMTGLRPAQKLDALNVGIERQTTGGSASTDAGGRARQMTLWGKVEIGLKAMPALVDRLSNPWGVAEKDIDYKLAEEMARINGDGSVEPTGDEGALHAARVLTSALEDARQMQNAKGAWIQRLPGYIARQSHDPLKVAGGMFARLGALADRVKAGEGFDFAGARAVAERDAFRAWHDAIRPKLDDRTFEGIDDQDLEAPGDKAAIANAILRDPADLREKFLYHVWADIVSGRHETLTGADDEGDFRRGVALARAISRERVLHFKTPRDWVDYNRDYGRSSLLATVMSQLERAGRNTALMERWGPDPEGAFADERARLAEEAVARGSPAEAKEVMSYMREARFEAVNGRGDSAENLRLARTMSTIRNVEAMAKLGSIVLSKATDLPLAGHTFARAGMGFLSGYRAFFQGVLRLGSEEAKRAADALDVGARAFSGHLGSQFQATDGARGWTSWGTRLLYKINGFEWFNNGVRHGAAEVISTLWGQEAGKTFNQLSQGMRETFQRFGITPEDWDKARTGLEAAPDGRTYFTLEHLGAEDQAAWKFRTLIHNLLDDTVSEPRARERAGITRGTRPGTLMGEALRAFFQFKGFINTIVGRHLLPATRGYAGYAPAALMAHFIAGTALAGYVSMNAKRIVSGVEPASPWNDDPGELAKTWAAALTQGGGLGLYGDFLFGALDRQGHDFDFGELGGPLLSDAQLVAKVVQQAVAGGQFNETTGRSPIPGELVRFASSNAPLVNLFYTRLALDYFLWWRLQEAASPGYLQRYQTRMENQAHRTFYVAPTSAP